MSVKETIFQVAVAALSVMGFYGILHGLFESLLVPRELATAVIITRPITPDELDMLLCEARRAPFGRGRRVVLVISPALSDGFMEEGGHLTEAYAETVEKYGVSLCICEEDTLT